MPTLNYITEIRMGTTLRGRDATRSVPDGPYQFLRIGDISQDGQCGIEDLIRIEPNEAVNESHVLRPGDVLFPNRGTRTTAFAFPGSPLPTIVGAQFFILRPKLNQVVPGFLAWFLRSEKARFHFDSRRKGTYVQIIQRKDLADLEIPLPSLAVQKTIIETARLAQEERILSEQLSQKKWRLMNDQLLQAATNFPS